MKSIEQMKLELQVLQAQLKLKSKQAKPQVSIADRKATAEKWFTEHNKVSIIQRGLNKVLPTKKGNKSYEAVKFSNGRIGVYLYGGSCLGYAWN